MTIVLISLSNTFMMSIMKTWPMLVFMTGFLFVSCKKEYPEPPLTPAITSSIEQSNDAGFAIVRGLHANGSRNVAISPAGITSAFGLILPGTSGETCDQILDVLGDTYEFQRYISSYARKSNDLNIANLLVVSDQFKLDSDYEHTTGRDHIRRVDFASNTERERHSINRWISEQTRGEIADMLAPGSISGLTKIVALNAISFEAQWQTEFDVKDTVPRTFHREGGDIMTPAMKKEFVFATKKSTDGTLALSLNYKPGDNREESLAFLIVMPPEGTSLNAFLKRTDWKQIKKLVAFTKKDYSKQILQIPKFEIRTQAIPLKNVFNKFGIRDAFDPEKADFSRMTTENGLYLGSILHQCFVKVDEQGTKAAAATAITIEAFAIVDQVNIDRPFIWFVYDNSLELVLFCGTMDDPSPGADNIP